MEKGLLQRQSPKQRAATAPRPSPRGEGRRAAARSSPARARGINRAVEIFQLLHAVRKPISIGEIAKRLRAPRSTIYEIVNLFLAAEILEYAGAGSEVYFGRAIHLYAVVAMQNSARLFRIGSDIGVLVPIPWTASGRLFVAHMTLAELTAFIPPEDFRMQDGTVIEPERFLAEAKAARERGICIIGGLVDDYATCVAAPIVAEPGGKCVASICFIVSSNISRDRTRELTQLLMESSRKLSRIEEETAAIGR
jgi:DNA-binding IclR family transcriptional regulator